VAPYTSNIAGGLALLALAGLVAIVGGLDPATWAAASRVPGGSERVTFSPHGPSRGSMTHHGRVRRCGRSRPAALGALICAPQDPLV